MVHNGSSEWWGEGDGKIDGAEDYYGYFRGGRDSAFFEAPFIAHPQVEVDKQVGYSAITRVRSLDAIPFTSRLRFDMEIWHWRATTMSYAAATYWYAAAGATSNRPPIPDEAARPILTEPPGSRRQN
jgi:hypothetical protein